ncbi:MAG: hypothetical protein ACRDOL_26445 [Streptosporangiaceae bacterium]
MPEIKATAHGTAQQPDDGNRPRATGRPVRPRAIGAAGTAARILVGAVLLGSVVSGEASRGWRPAAWVLALLVFPAAALAAAWVRARRHRAGLRATGPAGHAVNAAVFAALYATPWYAPPLGFTSDAALIFYGASLLLAAARGYAGCEVAAVPNWLLRRDDQVGCVVFAPVDALERRRTAPGGQRDG